MLSQSSIVFAALLFAYVVFTTTKGELTTWLQILGIAAGGTSASATAASGIGAGATVSGTTPAAGSINAAGQIYDPASGGYIPGPPPPPPPFQPPDLLSGSINAF